MRPAVLLALAVLAFARVSLAADPSEVERLYAEGIELRRHNQDLQALDRFQRAHALQPSARTQAQIGFAEQALGRWTDAERDLQAALGMPDPWIEKNRAAVARALELVGDHLGTLELDGTPSAEVRIDGARAGTLPLPQPLRVQAGLVTIELTAEGFAPALRTVPITAHRLHRERIELVKLAAPSPVIASAAEPAPIAARPHDRRLWLSGWTLLGAGAGLLAAGIAGVGVREAAAARYNGNGCIDNGLDRDDNCGDLRGTVRTGEQLGLAGFVAGGALVVGAIALLATDAARRQRAK